MTEQVYTLSDTEKEHVHSSPLTARRSRAGERKGQRKPRPASDPLYDKLLSGLAAGTLIGYAWLLQKSKECGVTTRITSNVMLLISAGYLQRTDQRGIYRVTGEKPI